MPEVKGQPNQYEIQNTAAIRFSKNGYAYEVSPLYGYEISALIVGKFNYRIFGIERFEKLFPVDLCLLWGSNASSKVYKNKAVRFSQD